MSQFEKALERVSKKPRDYTYDEARYILGKIGFIESNKGKTSGSRVAFYRSSDGKVIMLHKPHPGNVLSPGGIDDFVAKLSEMGVLK